MIAARRAVAPDDLVDVVLGVADEGTIEKFMPLTRAKTGQVLIARELPGKAGGRVHEKTRVHYPALSSSKPRSISARLCYDRVRCALVRSGKEKKVRFWGFTTAQFAQLSALPLSTDTLVMTKEKSKDQQPTGFSTYQDCCTSMAHSSTGSHAVPGTVV